jgi:long-subunit acyl-CoA synthetase (AMP-forming)
MIEETTATATAPAEPAALHAATMCEAFQLTAAARPDQVALRTISGGISITFAEYADRVRRLAGGFHALGVRRGDTVAFMLHNRPEFHSLDAAVMHLGATPFSVYNTSSPDQIAFLLGDARPNVFVVESQYLEVAREAMAIAGGVEHVVLLDGSDDDAIHPDELERAEPGPEFDFEQSWRAVAPDDVLTLIYTSGTTGPPKGVQLTHANEIAQCRGVHEAAPWLGAGGATISYLPMAHIADRGLTHYGQMFWGDELTCCPDPAQVFAHVADTRPTRFGAVPRVWEKLMAALQAGFETEPDETRRAGIRQALELALEKVRAEQRGEPVPDELLASCETAEQRVFAPIRAKLGFDRCQSYIIGAAPAPVEVFEFFAAIGIPICEVWGMSELSSIATLVPLDRVRFGTVGQAIPGVEIKLADDGEVLVRGDTVMAGYRNQPEKTAETIGADGWLRTGDIGELSDDGFLKIVDRKKELIINAAGKNMSPANIEQHLKSGSPLIGQAIAIGDRRPYNVALIVLDPDVSKAFAQNHGLDDASPEAMAQEPSVQEEVQKGVAAANEKLSRVEQIKRFKVLSCDWPPAGEELTPTMKLKRKPIAAKYAVEIEGLYTREGA